jgi:CheY-like chemotaxis protein
VSPPKTTARPTPAQRTWLARGLDEAGGKLPLFDHDGQRIDPRTIQSCIQQGWAEPWFSNPLKPDWLVCRLTSAGRAAVQPSGPARLEENAGAAEWLGSGRERPPPLELEGKTALIVDDDAASLGLYRTLLENAGMSVVEARNGLQALRLACERSPDLLITDLRLPILSGLEVIRRLRSHPACGQLPIVVATAITSPEYRRQCEEAGSNAFVAKPISVLPFLEVVRGCLGPSRLRHTHS